MLTLKVVGRDILELYENDPLNLKFQYSDIEKIQSSVSSYSQSFRLPATAVNVDFFGTFFNVNNQGGFNPKRKKKAELFYNTVPIISGFIQLKKVYIQKENYADFEIVFFGDTLDLARTLGDQKLVDLDLSGYDHTLNYTNYTLARVGALFSGDIRYGLIDKGKNFSNIGTGTPMNAANPVQLSDFVPCLRVRELVETILSDNGFTLSSTFFDGQDDIYTPFFNGKTGPGTALDLSSYTMAVGIYITSEVLTAIGTGLYQPITFIDTGLFFDTEGMYNAATYVFTPPFNSYYLMQVTANITAGTGGGDFNVQIYNDTDGIAVWQSESFFLESSEQYQFLGEPILLLDTTKTYKYKIYSNQQSGSITLGAGESSPGVWRTGWRVLDVSPPISGQTVSMESNAPDIKQIDYLTSLQKMFNLVFIADKLDPSKILIETFNDYNSGGEIKDWTEYVDYSKDVVLSPTTDLQFKDYEWSYTKGADYVNKFYEDNADRIYGRYRIEDGENDFSVSEMKVQPDFAPFPLVPIPGTSIMIHKAIDEKGEVIKKPLPWVVYYERLTIYGLFINDNGTLRTESEFPYLGHYSTVSPDVEDYDLNFGGEIPTYPIEANPYNNLYNTYWREYVNQLYSTEARIMDAHLYLDVADIASFEFSDQIWIKDSYWRILSIDYSPNSKDTSKVKLIKILADVRACDEIPYQSNTNGVVTFIDAAGVTGAPSQTCCERFGYVYISGVCYQSYNNPIAPTNTYDPSVVVGEAMNSEVGLRVFAQGANIIAPNNQYSFISGTHIELQPQALQALAIGEQIDVSAINNLVATGSNVNAFVEGLHRGGGWWYANYGTGNKGAAQNIVIPFIFEGDFADTDEVELFIEGKLNNRLSIPAETTMYVRADIVVSTYNVAGGAVIGTQTLVFFDAFKKIAGVATSNYGTDLSPATVNIGTFGASNMILNIDTTTDTAQHRLLMHNNGDTNTYKTRIVCYMNCVMVTW